MKIWAPVTEMIHCTYCHARWTRNTQSKTAECRKFCLICGHHTPKKGLFKKTSPPQIFYCLFSIPKLPEGKSWPQVPKNLNEPLNYIKITSPDNIKSLRETNFGNPDFWNALPFKENENLFSQIKTKTEL